MLRAPKIYVVKNLNLNAVQKFWTVKFISMPKFPRRVHVMNGQKFDLGMA